MTLPCLSPPSLVPSPSYTRTARLNSAAADLGFVISAPKTEYKIIVVNCCPQPPLEVYGSTINHVQDFIVEMPQQDQVI